MDGAESPPPVAGRFLKVIIPGFESALKLPQAFCKMLSTADLNSNTAVLNTSKGFWNVDVKKCDHGCLHFLGKTWEGYVSDHNLKEGDFIVFEHNGLMHFNTIMFDDTYCEKDFATLKDEEEEEESSENDVMSIESTEDDDVEHMSENYEENAACDRSSNQNATSRFQKTLTKRTITKGSVNVPTQFASSNDMMQSKTVELRNGTGDSWLVKLQVYNAVARKQFVFTGLTKFLRENKLEIGDKCTFELVERPSTSRQDLHVLMDVVFERQGLSNN